MSQYDIDNFSFSTCCYTGVCITGKKANCNPAAEPKCLRRVLTCFVPPIRKGWRWAHQTCADQARQQLWKNLEPREGIKLQRRFQTVTNHLRKDLTARKAHKGRNPKEGYFGDQSRMSHMVPSPPLR